jgi:ankyrin repeat protein
MICCDIKPYVQGGMFLGLLLLLIGCSTPSPQDGDSFCRSAEGMRQYIETNSNPNLQITVSPADSSDGEISRSLLACAVRTGDLSLVKLVVSKGADVDGQASSRGFETPLYEARNLDIARFLVDNGAIIKAKVPGATTPLFWAQSYEIARLLIDRGADVKAVDAQGMTPLHGFASRYPIDAASKQESFQISQLLVRQGADVNAKTLKGDTPLHRASDKKVAMLLVNHGAKVNVQNEKLETPLHRATHSTNGCRREWLLDFLLNDNLVNFLLDNGAEVNVQDAQGKTPLHWAIDRGAYCDNHNISILLKNGADVDLKNKSGISPLTQAIQNYERSRGPYKMVSPEEEALIESLKSRHNPLKEK